MIKTDLKVHPSIFIVCSNAYKEGILHGVWIDIGNDEPIQDVIARLIKSSPIANAEKWHVLTHSGYPDFYNDCTDIDSLIYCGENLIEYGQPYYQFLQYYPDKADFWNYSTTDLFREAYAGVYASREAFARNNFLVDHGLPSKFADYINWSKRIDELFTNEFFSAPATNGVYIYTRCH